MMAEPISLISTVGFPIGAFLLMWQFATKSLKENTKAIIDLREVILRAMK